MSNSIIKYQASTIIELKAECFNAPILSHTYTDGYGKIEFEGNLTVIGDFTFSTTTTLFQSPCPTHC